MLVAYIMRKSRGLAIKPLLRDCEVFTYDGKEYEIDIEAVYTKKFFGVKTFFWILYIEGVRNPVKFGSESFMIDKGKTRLDTVSIMMNRLRRSKEEIIILILIALNLLVSIGIYATMRGG